MPEVQATARREGRGKEAGAGLQVQFAPPRIQCKEIYARVAEILHQAHCLGQQLVQLQHGGEPAADPVEQRQLGDALGQRLFGLLALHPLLEQPAIAVELENGPYPGLQLDVLEGLGDKIVGAGLDAPQARV